MWGKILWIRLGSGELRLLTFCWPGLSHMVTPPAREARKGGQTLCLRGRGYGFHDYMTTSAILSSPPQNHDSLSQEERMNIEGQLVVSVLEGKTMIRKLQPKIVFIPRSFVFSPCFGSHLWELGQRDSRRSSLCLLLDPGHVLNIFVRMSPK